MNETFDPETAGTETLVAEVTDKFMERLRRGERPDVEDYARRYPQIATILRHILPALEVIGSSGSGRASRLGSSFPDIQPEGTLGDYRIVREIVRGGMGIVYQAVQISLGREVALKVLPFAAAMDQKQLQRFKNEAQAAAQLDHTNIVPVYGVGCERGVHYYAMQYIEGQTGAAIIAALRQLSGLDSEKKDHPAGSVAELTRDLAAGRWAPASRGKEGPVLSATVIGLDSPSAWTGDVPPADPTRSAAVTSTESSTRKPAYFRTVANLGVQAASALEHAHGLGVIHRDIKPANLIVDLRGNLWITDFGLARLQGGADLTVTGDLVGTLRYMSPEQALAERIGVDHRTDVYSLGMTLYELLTLEPAFSGRDRRELLRQIAFEEPRRPQLLNKAVPADLETIVLKAIEKNPSERYAGAQELADDLERFLDDKTIKARRPTLWERARKWSRRHKPVVATAAVAVVLLLVAVGVVASVAAFWLRAERNATLQQLKETRKAQKEGQRQLYEAKLAQAKASRWSGRAGRRFEGLQALSEAARLAHDLDLGAESILTLRNEAIACMALVDVRLDHKWRGYPPGSTLTGIAFDAEMNHYARVDENGHITVRRLENNQEMVRITDTGAPASPGRAPDWRMTLLFSPDGQFLAAAGNSDGTAPLQVWELKGPKSLVKAGPAGGFERTIDFRPDSRVLAARGPDQSSIRLFDVRAARELNHFAVGRRVECLRFHPRGDRIAVSLGSEVRIVDLAGRPLLQPLAHPRPTRALSWSTDGRLLATACDDGQAYVWEVRAGKPEAICRCAPSGGVGYVAFNQRGDLLSAVGDSSTLWDPWSGKELLRTGGLASDFSRDDRWLGLGVFGPEVGRWEVATGGEYRALQGHSHGTAMYSLDISPEGWLLASAGDDGVRLWDLAAGNEVATLPTGRAESATWDTSGRFLLTASAAGIHRWPIRVETGPMPSRLYMGPAESIRARPGYPAPAHQASLNGDGRTLVAKTRRGDAVILDLERPDASPRLINHTVSYLGLSPDTKWVATMADNAFESKLWDARNGKWVRDFPGMRSARVAFSPDNRWLVFGTAQEYIFHHAGSWQPGPRLSRDFAGGALGPLAFTRSGETVAIAPSSREIKLLDVESGRELATLAAPVPEFLTSLCFAPDGGRLVAGTTTGVIQLWDLRRIRQQLRDAGLDWDSPVQPSRSAGDGKPMQVEVDLGELPDLERSSLIVALFPFHAEAYYRRGLAHEQLDQFPESLDDFRRTLALKPDHAEAHYHRGLVRARQGNAQEAIADWSETITVKPDHAEAYAARADAYYSLGRRAEAARDYAKVAELCPDWPEFHNDAAWLLATNPDPRRRDAGRAVVLAQKAVELAPDEGIFWNTLGAAHYRAGHWDQAIKALTRSRDLLGSQFESFDTFFLAMAHWQLGNKTEARHWYDRAVRSMPQNQPDDEELRRFRAEAVQLLGIGDPIRSENGKGLR